MARKPTAWSAQNDDGTAVVHREIRVVCTDKGTHASREIGVLTRWDDDDDMVIAPTDKLSVVSNRLGSERARLKESLTHEGKGIVFDDVTWRFRCPTCRREIQWRLGRAIAAVDALLAAGRVRVDVSELPANMQ